MPASEATLKKLIAQIATMNTELSGLKKSEQTRKKWTKLGVIVGSVLIAVSLLLGILALNALDKFLDERTSRSIAACEQENARFATAFNGIADALEPVISDTAFIELIRTAGAPRVCTAKGVAEYLEGIKSNDD